MPLSWPSWFSRVSRAAGDSVSPSIETGSPRFEADLDHRRLVRRVLGRDRALVDIFGRLDRRVLEHLPLGRGVEEVGVDRERGFAALVLRDRDLVLLGEVDQLLAAGELPFAPRRDDPDVGLERIIAELEADLVVALAGGAVADRVGADRPGDLDLALGDQRPGDRGAEQILALVDRVRPEHREDVVADELLAQILDEDVLRPDAEQLRLAPRRLDLLALAEVGGEGDDLGAIFGLKPFEDDRGVEPARISEHDLLGGGEVHIVCPSSSAKFVAPAKAGAPVGEVRGRLRRRPDPSLRWA